MWYQSTTTVLTDFLCPSIISVFNISEHFQPQSLCEITNQLMEKLEGYDIFSFETQGKRLRDREEIGLPRIESTVGQTLFMLLRIWTNPQGNYEKTAWAWAFLNFAPFNDTFELYIYIYIHIVDEDFNLLLRDTYIYIYILLLLVF